MWISRDKWLDTKLRAEIYNDTSKHWEENYTNLLNTFEKHNKDLFNQAQNPASQRRLDELVTINTQLSHVILAKDSLIKSLLEVIEIYKKTNEGRL